MRSKNGIFAIMVGGALALAGAFRANALSKVTAIINRLPLAIAAVIALGAGGQAQAATIGVATTPDPTEEFTNGAFVLGYSFTVNSPISVTLLGVYDDSGHPLITSHDVGLWDSSGTLLASTTVPAGVPAILDQDYAFAPIGSVALTVGGTYTVGATVPLSSGNDIWLQDPLSLAAAPEITYGARQYTFYSGTLIEPTLSGSGTTGYFGGNFAFGPVAVPEPSALTLLGFGLVAIGFTWRRRMSC